MGKELWCCTAKPIEPVSCSFGLSAQPFELPTRPANDIEIDPFESRTQCCPIEVAEIVDPATNARVGDRDQIIQGFVAMQMKPPASYRPADRLQRITADSGHEAMNMKVTRRHRFPCSERKPQEVKRDAL